MTAPRNISEEALLADGRPFVRCGCGFLAISSFATENTEVFDGHACPNAPARPVVYRRVPWYAPLFSLWGALIVFLICSAILAGMGVKW